MTSFNSRALRRNLLACGAVAALGLASGLASPALAQASGPAALSLQSQPLELALPALARQADIQLLYAPALVR
ncbi:hypothetical protein DMC18_24830, partial [Caulobacter sp. D5]|uniref:hypothetical protein n=1 Tax=Caulobacter sp. D5 TaxID=357400 RepID=UPI000D9451BA